jgi:hypothetical protein
MKHRDELGTWFKHTSASPYQECFKNSDMSIDTVLSVALRLDDCLLMCLEELLIV